MCCLKYRVVYAVEGDTSNCGSDQRPVQIKETYCEDVCGEHSSSEFETQRPSWKMTLLRKILTWRLCTYFRQNQHMMILRGESFPWMVGRMPRNIIITETTTIIIITIKGSTGDPDSNIICRSNSKVTITKSE